jgi:beta-xylosidase
MSSTQPPIETIGDSDRPWNDTKLSAEERVAVLIERMTLREKVAQLYGIWVGSTPEGGVAPHQNDMGEVGDFDELLSFGLGQLTRSFGTNPVDPGIGAAGLAIVQRKIAASNRFGIPALAHEECLAGFTTWGATAFPVPLSWGASFNPELVGKMAERIGTGMRQVGVHQGLAPVLDVTRDPRWGRTEETIGEDPYLVGTIATAYIKGLESTGIVATLKHFVGYSASKAGRNLAPVSMGPREESDVMLPPFEMAIRESGVRSVMHSYADIDGVPAVANEELLTTLLRDTWGFDGTVVADYFGIGFLKLLHGLAGTWGEAGALALKAGVDVELPTVKAYSDPLIGEIEAGRLAESYVDRALERVLRQKLELGLLEPDWSPLPDGWTEEDLIAQDAQKGRFDLDSDENRAVARELAQQAVVLVANDGLLPLASDGRTAPTKIAVIGPVANDPMAMLGCYSFPSHVGIHHPELPLGIELPTVVDAIRAEFGESEVSLTLGCDINTDRRDGFDEAVAAARDADLVIVVLGDRAGLFGLGTSGEGCDAESLALPGVQGELLEAVLDAGTPTVAQLVAGRPYFLGTAPSRAGAIVEAFFPGEAGAEAIAGVLSGRVNPTGKLPLSVPAHAGAQPWTYLAPKLARKSAVSNIDPTPVFGFGHGLSYTSFDWSDFTVNGSTAAGEVTEDSEAVAQLATDGSVRVSLTVRNTGARDGAEIVQLYLHDPVAQVVQPVQRLVGYARVDLAVGEQADVEFEVPADVASFTGISGTRVVEPGALELRIARSSQLTQFAAVVAVTGEVRTVDHTRKLHCQATITR